MTGRLAKRYARALLGLMRTDETREAAAAELAVAAAAFSDPHLRAVLESPVVHVDDRLKVSRRIIEALALSPHVADLLRLLAQRERLDIVPELVRSYDTLLDLELGRMRIVVRTAAALDDTEQQRVIDLARRLTGCQNILARCVVEPDLLGGVLIDIGGTIYDGSLKTQLERLSREMAARL